MTDPRHFALLVGRWMLARLDSQHELSLVLEREGGRLTALRDAYRAGTDAGFAAAGDIIRHWLGRR